MTNIKPGSVVVGVDGSSHSDAAVAWAVTYAVLADRPLMLVNATDWNDHRMVLTTTAEARHQRRILGRRLTDHALGLAKRIAADLDVSALTLNGDPREVLVELSGQASMVVVGTRGHGAVASLLLGSVSVAVATHARSAVAVVRPRQHPVNRIVVGIAGDGSDRTALELAAELATATGYAVHAVHAWQTGETGIDALGYEQRLDTMERHERIMDQALAGVVEKYPDVTINRHMPDASPVAALVERSTTAEVVVVGSRGRTSTLGLLGSVSRAVVEHAHSTVLVVRS